MKLCLFIVFTMFALAKNSQAAEGPTGVVGDGKTDDTAAIQTALDNAGRGGGEVFLPGGRYLVHGSLNVPTGVTLQGSWNAPHHGAIDKGSTLLLTGGRGQEEGPAAIELHASSAIRGFTMLWPEQKWGAIVPYPWAIHGVDMHNTVENVTFVNAWQGIMIGRPWSELHLIRNVNGCVLRRGVFIDTTSDIGRIENVHFNAHYWPRSRDPSIGEAHDNDLAVGHYMAEHLEAFVFGRCDWEYVQNTFVWAAKIGYHFIATPAELATGSFPALAPIFARHAYRLIASKTLVFRSLTGSLPALAAARIRG